MSKSPLNPIMIVYIKSLKGRLIMSCIVEIDSTVIDWFFFP